jgi:hypothetical protein
MLLKGREERRKDIEIDKEAQRDNECMKIRLPSARGGLGGMDARRVDIVDHAAAADRAEDRDETQSLLGKTCEEESQRTSGCGLFWRLVAATLVAVTLFGQPGPLGFPAKQGREFFGHDKSGMAGPSERKLITTHSPRSRHDEFEMSTTAGPTTTETWDAESFTRNVPFEAAKCTGLFHLNTGILAYNKSTGAIAVNGPNPLCYMPSAQAEWEGVVKSALARAKMRSVLPEQEAKDLVSPDDFNLSDYELVMIDLLVDDELIAAEWLGIANRSWEDVTPKKDFWVKRSACGAGGCIYQVGRVLREGSPPQPPGGGAHTFIHDLLTGKQSLPEGNRTKKKRLVYFHCASGVDRTGTLAIAYKIAYQNMSLTRAVKSLSRGKESYDAVPADPYQDWIMRWCYSVYNTTKGVCAVPPESTRWSLRSYPKDIGTVCMSGCLCNVSTEDMVSTVNTHSPDYHILGFDKYQDSCTAYYAMQEGAFAYYDCRCLEGSDAENDCIGFPDEPSKRSGCRYCGPSSQGGFTECPATVYEHGSCNLQGDLAADKRASSALAKLGTDSSKIDSCTTAFNKMVLAPLNFGKEATTDAGVWDARCCGPVQDALENQTSGWTTPKGCVKATCCHMCYGICHCEDGTCPYYFSVPAENYTTTCKKACEVFKHEASKNAKHEASKNDAPTRKLPDGGADGSASGRANRSADDIGKRIGEFVQVADRWLMKAEDAVLSGLKGKAANSSSTNSTNSTNASSGSNGEARGLLLPVRPHAAYPTPPGVHKCLPESQKHLDLPYCPHECAFFGR